MISELDDTIKQLLVKKGAFDPAEVDISFETPDREWAASISKPTVSVYLYDVRENHQLRGTEWTIETNARGIATRKKNPTRVDLSYLVTVWTNDINDEHALLWHVMGTLFRYPTIPDDVLVGRLAQQDCPIVTTTAQPDGYLKSPADFWGALNNDLKPSVNYVVTLPLDLDMAFTAPVVRTKTVRVKHPDSAEREIVQVAGLVRQTGKPDSIVAGARIIAREAGMSTETDNEGHYLFATLWQGKHTFQVIVPGKKTVEAPITIPSPSYDLEV